MNKLFAAIGLSAGLFAQSALACSDPQETYDRELSDLIVEGRIVCNQETDKCSIAVRKGVKPSNWSRFDSRTVRVSAGFSDIRAMQQSDTIYLTCPGPFSPQADTFYGRFYLVYDEEDRRYRVRRYYVRDTDGQFYHYGIKCDPEVENRDGTTSQTCEVLLENDADDNEAE